MPDEVRLLPESKHHEQISLICPFNWKSINQTSFFAKTKTHTSPKRPMGILLKSGNQSFK
jgi:hypothetical protein